MYESDLTKFMRQLFTEKPHLAQAQREARAIWWDKKVDFAQLKRLEESRVPVRGYVYYPLLQPPESQSTAEPGAKDRTQS